MKFNSPKSTERYRKHSSNSDLIKGLLLKTSLRSGFKGLKYPETNKTEKTT